VIATADNGKAATLVAMVQGLVREGGAPLPVLGAVPTRRSAGDGHRCDGSAWVADDHAAAIQPPCAPGGAGRQGATAARDARLLATAPAAPGPCLSRQPLPATDASWPCRARSLLSPQR
jgi:hypothetical protein